MHVFRWSCPHPFREMRKTAAIEYADTSSAIRDQLQRPAFSLRAPRHCIGLYALEQTMRHEYIGSSLHKQIFPLEYEMRSLNGTHQLVFYAYALQPRSNFRWRWRLRADWWSFALSQGNSTNAVGVGRIASVILKPITATVATYRLLLPHQDHDSAIDAL